MAGKLKAKVEFLADTKGLLKGVDAIEGRFNKLGNTLERHSAKLMGAGLAIGAGLGVAVKVAGDFDQSLRNMASVAKPTERELKAIHDMALKLGRESIHGPRKLAEVTYTLASAGMKAAKQMKVLPGISKLAAATQADLGQATELTVGALNSFGYEADQTDRIINAFAATIGASQANMDRLQASLKDVAPVAGQLGQEIEDLLVPLGVLYDANINASTAGVALKNILLDLANPTATLQDLLEKLGISEADVSSKTHTVVEAFDVFKQAGATSTDMMAAFGKESAAVAAVLFGQTTKALNENREAITGTKAAYEMAELQAEGFSQILALTKASLEGAGIAIGEVLLPHVKDMAVMVTTAAIAFSDLDPKIVDVGVKAVAAVGGVALLGGAFGWTHKKAKWLYTKLSALGRKIAHLGVIVKASGLGTLLPGLIPVALGGLALSTAARIETLGEAEGDWARQRESIYARIKATEDMFDPTSAEYADSMVQLNNELMALAEAYLASADYAAVAAAGIEDVGETALTAAERAEALVGSLIEGVSAAFDKVGSAAKEANTPFDEFMDTIGLGEKPLEDFTILMERLGFGASITAEAIKTIVAPLEYVGATITALPDPEVEFGERWLAAGAMAAEGLEETLQWLFDIEGHMTTALPGAGKAMVGAFRKIYGEMDGINKMTWKAMKKATAQGWKAILDMYIEATLGQLLATQIGEMAKLGMAAFLNPGALIHIGVVAGLYGAAKAAIGGINTFDESAVITRGGAMSGRFSVGDTIISPDAIKNFMKGGGGGGRSVQVSVSFNGSYVGDSAGFRDDIDYLADQFALALDNG